MRHILANVIDLINLTSKPRLLGGWVKLKKKLPHTMKHLLCYAPLCLPPSLYETPSCGLGQHVSMNVLSCPWVS